MKYFMLIILLNAMMNTNNSAQELSRHKWKDRLILILAQDSSNAIVDEQLTELKNEENGLRERKIVIYNVSPHQYYRVFPEKGGIIKSKELFDEYKDSDAPFEIILIGLDGGVKLRETELLTTEKLFAVIDGMPMRRREIESNGSN